MILAVLAAAAAAATGDPAASPDVVVHAPTPVVSKIDVQSSDNENTVDFVAVWPMGAYDSKVNGEVKLSCFVDAYGLAESCEVVSEDPQRLGFGKAALELRPTFKLTPAKGPNGPIGSTMTLTIHFKAPNTQFGVGATESAGIPSGQGSASNLGSGMQVQNPLNLRAVTMLDNPVWAQAASYAQTMAAYPAKANGQDGYAVAHCKVDPDGGLSSCQVIKETPTGLGFGPAAVALAADFRVAASWTRAPDRGELWVDLPVRFTAPGDAGERSVVSPRWLIGVDPASAPKLYPPEAAEKGVTTGVGVARCVVAANGGLVGCAPEAGDPEGLGFSDAAVRLAQVMKMNPWSNDAAPVDGAVVRVRVRLNLAPG